MTDPAHRGIARAFLPNRHHYWYARCKLASDPLYTGVGRTLRDTRVPLLDLGCGIGLLAHTLRAQGFSGAYLGIDNDAAKIAAARDAAVRARLSDARFECIDLAREEFPAHRGSVTLLDILQFLPAHAVTALIERAAACIVPGAKLVIRTGLDDGGLRQRITRAVDAFSQRVGWMNAAPVRYPARAALSERLARNGLRASFMPLHGRTPFNNWLVTAVRADAQSGFS